MPRPLPSPATLFRHFLAAFVGIGLITAAYSLLGFSLYREALLGNRAPRGELLRSSFIFAVAATALCFAPAAALFEWRRVPAWLAPFILAPALALLWFVLQVFNGTHDLRGTWVIATIVGVGLSITFCAYWIPLRFIARRLTPPTM